MREKKRIERILNLIKELWEARQDQRLGQMLINIGLVPDEMRVWNTEDDIWEKHLKKELKK